jgi:predicted anti-sigma-YlaC factor YlaD
MWCWYYRRRMQALLGGVLSARGEAALRRHLDTCHDCAKTWENHCRTRSLLRSWSAPQPSPIARRRVMAAIQADPFAREYRRFGPVWWRRAMIECAIGVALVLIALQLLIGGTETKVVSHHSPAPPPGNACLTENYLVELMNDPRTAHLSDGERYILLSALVSLPAGAGEVGGCPDTDGP